MQLIDTIAIVLSIGGLIAYLEYRILPLIAVELPEPEVRLVPLEKTFICHYCGRRYPVEQQEKFGSYVYCKEHGRARQAVAPTNGQVQPLRPQVKIVQSPSGDKMPWEN